MIEELHRVFSNTTRALEALYVQQEVKKAARMDASDFELEKIREHCSKNNLFLEVSDFKVVKQKDEGKGKYSNIVRRVPLSHPLAGLYHVYISKDKNAAKFLKIVEAKNDDRTVGEILGYPKCCIDFFMENRGRQQNIQNDYILPALKNSEGFVFPFHTNYAARYFDATLISHFPHSFNCKETKRIAKKNLGCVEKHSKQLAQKIVGMLKSAVLYTESKGVFLLKDYAIKGSNMEFSEVKGTADNEIKRWLEEHKKLKVAAKNNIIVGRNKLDKAGVMAFE